MDKLFTMQYVNRIDNVRRIHTDVSWIKLQHVGPDLNFLYHVGAAGRITDRGTRSPFRLAWIIRVFQRPCLNWIVYYVTSVHPREH
jgi:hypothetical protein